MSSLKYSFNPQFSGRFTSLEILCCDLLLSVYSAVPTFSFKALADVQCRKIQQKTMPGLWPDASKERPSRIMPSLFVACHDGRTGSGRQSGRDRSA